MKNDLKRRLSIYVSEKTADDIIKNKNIIRKILNSEKAEDIELPGPIPQVVVPQVVDEKFGISVRRGWK